MKLSNAKPDRFKGLRAEAEARLKKKIAKLQQAFSGDTDRLIHELQVHQVELEMQNEELRRAQQELEQGRARYCDLYDLAPVGYFTFDNNGLIIEANLTGCQMLGVERKDLIKKPFHSFVSGESQDAFYKHRQAARTPGLQQTCEITLLRKDGGKFEAQLESIPAADVKGDFTLCRTIITDITERKQAEQASQEVHRRLTTVFESFTDAFFNIDKDWRFTYVNAEGEKLLGKTRGELLGNNIWEMFPPAAGSKFQREYERAVAENKAVHFEEFYPPLNIWFEVHAYPSQYGLSVYFRDITERQKYEEQLRQINEELTRSNADLNQFAYVASHDLREPLRAITGFMDLLRRRCKDTLDKKANEYIDYAANGAKRMDDLLTGLLEYSRVQTQGKPRAAVSAQAALNTAMTNLHESIAESNATISSDPLPSVNVDGMQFTQLLQNLIHNALKFRTDQRPEVHVGCKKQEDGWQFCVRDNGIGIGPQFQERIFTIFHRANPQDKRSGYGVGLSICKRIVERHGGKIWVEAKPGSGSAFYFTISDKGGLTG